MLISSKDVSRLEVVPEDTGETSGKVGDIIFDPKQERILAYVVKQGLLPGQVKVVLDQDVRKITKNELWITSQDKLMDTNELPENIRGKVKNPKYLEQTELTDSQGNTIGNVKAVYIDTETKSIKKINASTGFMKETEVEVDDVVEVTNKETVVKKAG